jgi:hypothetical protein
MRLLPSILLFFALSSTSAQERRSLEQSRCHVFIDYQFIWTLEVVSDYQGNSTPILNIVTIVDGQWDLRPNQIHLKEGNRREFEIERFSIDTGVGDGLQRKYLKVLGESFIGIDLQGEFQQLDELTEVSIELGNDVFVLEPVDCLRFETIVHQVNQINYDSPDIRQDYDVLKIDVLGKREARRRFY